MRKILFFSCFVTVFGFTVVCADSLTGLPDITVEDNAIVDITFGGKTYVVANGDLALGETTRWYLDASNEPVQWQPGAPGKAGDVGSKADNFLLRDAAGAVNISSLDDIAFQVTIFDVPTSLFFLFERGGNDSGTWQAIHLDGSLGDPVQFNGATDYADTPYSSGQPVAGVAFQTDIPVKGVRINSPGHDTHSISTPAPVNVVPVNPLSLPNPGGQGISAGPILLQWAYSEEVDVQVDSYTLFMDTDPGLVAEPNLPGEPMLIDGTGDATGIAPEIDPGQSASYAFSNIEMDKVYYWRIVANVREPNAVTHEYNIPVVVYGAIWSFSAETSGPVVNAGGSLITWLEQGEMSFVPEATVTDATNDLDTVAWSVIGSPIGSTVDISDTGDPARPVITVDREGAYLLKLRAEDKAGNDPAEELVEIMVYADNCEAAKNDPDGYTAPAYDFNNDCRQDIADLEMFAISWLEDKSMDDNLLY